MRLSLCLPMIAALAACGPADAPPIGPGHDAQLLVGATFDKTPLTRLGNMLRITVKDPNGVAVTGAKVVVTVVMVAHGHAATSPQVRELDGGEYVADAVNFTMAGSWVVTAAASKAALQASLTLTVDSP